MDALTHLVESFLGGLPPPTPPGFVGRVGNSRIGGGRPPSDEWLRFREFMRRVGTDILPGQLVHRAFRLAQQLDRLRHRLRKLIHAATSPFKRGADVEGTVVVGDGCEAEDGVRQVANLTLDLERVAGGKQDIEAECTVHGGGAINTVMQLNL